MNSCNASCTQQWQGWNDLDVYGKCDEKGVCRCYHRSMCEEQKCSKTCREKHGTENNLKSECIDGVCTCTWNKKCELSACETYCKKVYAGKPNIEWNCEEDKCYCKWHGVVRGPAPGSSGSDAAKREEKLHLVETDSFYLEKEVQFPDAKKAAQ